MWAMLPSHDPYLDLQWLHRLGRTTGHAPRCESPIALDNANVMPEINAGIKERKMNCFKTLPWRRSFIITSSNSRMHSGRTCRLTSALRPPASARVAEAPPATPSACCAASASAAIAADPIAEAGVPRPPVPPAEEGVSTDCFGLGAPRWPKISHASSSSSSPAPPDGASYLGSLLQDLTVKPTPLWPPLISLSFPPRSQQSVSACRRTARGHPAATKTNMCTGTALPWKILWCPSAVNKVLAHCLCSGSMTVRVPTREAAA